MNEEKLIVGQKYTLLDLGYHIALPEDKQMVIEDAKYLRMGRRETGALVSFLLVFKKGTELYGCEWSTSRHKTSEHTPTPFLEVVARGGEVKQWK